MGSPLLLLTRSLLRFHSKCRPWAKKLLFLYSIENDELFAPKVQCPNDEELAAVDSFLLGSTIQILSFWQYKLMGFYVLLGMLIYWRKVAWLHCVLIFCVVIAKYLIWMSSIKSSLKVGTIKLKKRLHGPNWGPAKNRSKMHFRSFFFAKQSTMLPKCF